MEGDLRVGLRHRIEGVAIGEDNRRGVDLRTDEERREQADHTRKTVFPHGCLRQTADAELTSPARHCQKAFVDVQSARQRTSQWADTVPIRGTLAAVANSWLGLQAGGGQTT